jgi:hypothetical protein
MNYRPIIWGNIVLTDVVPDKYQWRCPVKMAMNFQFPYNFGEIPE